MKKTGILLFNFLFILLLSCDKDRDDFDNNFILLEMQTDENLDYENPEFEISLYGHNDTIADTGANLITSQNFSAKEFPFIIRMDIPANPYAKIENLEENSNARFYITIQWDSDNNGQNCAGDIDLDENVQDVELINIDRRDAQDIFLHTISETTPCD
ncbi:hypothetical protein [Autumnicola musiva]|uniref:Lipoprotein n=1 Tax=Autumnicola musiva TaxID=3075589 RepID=A0ABU3D2L2_9FLAO|nr:hypothetical protein [Zunongwangia sp. F117]MDT0675634.1 hypothetical protein [Zunongwangia sp. F117]